jgi:hypothetical protein
MSIKHKRVTYLYWFMQFDITYIKYRWWQNCVKYIFVAFVYLCVHTFNVAFGCTGTGEENCDKILYFGN